MAYYNDFYFKTSESAKTKTGKHIAVMQHLFFHRCRDCRQISGNAYCLGEIIAIKIWKSRGRKIR